jgi:phosphopantetheinyl transferase
MEDRSAAKDLVWEEQQRSDRTRTRFERREWLKSFLLVFALIALTLAATTVLAR